MPLGMTPWGSSEPNGTRTVAIRAGTSSPNSCQQSRAISRVVGAFVWAAAGTKTAAARAAAVRTVRVFLMSVASSLPSSYVNPATVWELRNAGPCIFPPEGL